MHNPAMATADGVIPIERIANRIYLIRGENVMLDSDLAELYGVSTAQLNQQVKRNIERFPPDFAFKLKEQEFTALMSQIVISNAGRGGRRKQPVAISSSALLNSYRRLIRAGAF